MHDSYWTHAGSIDQMNAIIRDTFIALHSSDVLSALAQEFRERYADYKVPLMALQGGALKKLNLEGAAAPEDIQALKEIESDEAEKPEEEASLAPEEDEDLELDELEEPEEKPKPKPKRKTKAAKTQENVEKRLAGKFVNLVDILPPLPQKGKFDVKAIKDSQYFFS